MDVNIKKSGRVIVRGGGRSFRGGGHRGFSDRGGGHRGFSDRGGGRSFRGGGRSFRGGGRSFRGGGRSYLGGGRSFRGGGRGGRNSKSPPQLGSPRSKNLEKLIFDDRPRDGEQEEKREEEEEVERIKDDNNTNTEVLNGLGIAPAADVKKVSNKKRKRKDEKSEEMSRGKRQKFDMTILLNRQLYYLSAIQREIEEGFKDDDDTDSFVTTVMNEVEKELPTLILHQQGNVQLQNIIPLMTQETIEPLQQVLLGDISEICSHRHGSKVLKAVLEKTFDWCNNSANESFNEASPKKENQHKFITWIKAIVNHVAENLEDFVLKQPANDLLVNLLAGLSGCPFKYGRLCNLDIPKSEIKRVPKQFQKYLSMIVKRLFCLELENWSDFVIDPLASRTLAKMLVFLSVGNEELCDELINGLIQKLFDATQSDNKLPTVLTTKVVKQVVWLMIACSSPSTNDCLFNNHLKPRVQSLAKDKVGKGFLQKLLRKVRSQEQAEMLCDEIIPMFAEMDYFLRKTNVIILQLLARVCVQYNVKESHFCKGLMSYLKCSEETFFPSLAYLQAYNGATNDGSQVTNVYGLRLLKELMLFNQPRQIVDSMLNTNRALLVSIFFKQIGPEIVGNFVRNKAIGTEDRTRLVNVLRGSFRKLSQNLHGRECLQIIWGAASLSDKKVIAQELVNHAKSSEPYHQSIHNGFHIRAFKNQPDIWESVQRACGVKNRIV